VRSFRFLLSRRWVLFALAVVALVYATWLLGGWQFHRLQSTRHGNDVIRTNEKAVPVPVGELLAPGRAVPDDDEWKRVTATGTYDAAHTITWRYRTDAHGVQGIDAVVPLVTADGTALLVDRGWIQSQDQDNNPVTIPTPPSGTVTVVGWVRQNGSGSATRVTDLGTRAVSSTAIAPAIGRSLYGGFVYLQSESPSTRSALTPNPLPELNDGPHFFYGVQWWFFGALAIVGFFYLLYDERRLKMRGEDDEPTPEAAAALAVRDARKQEKAEKLARKQAVAAAYAAARAKDEANRTKAFGPSVDRAENATENATEHATAQTGSDSQPEA
jgi:cytochrome oxidase assembly protein ShyY1